MEPATVTGKTRGGATPRGIVFIGALVMVSIFSISLLAARGLWERELQRDREQELLYRARHLVRGIEAYQQQHGSYPLSLEILREERLIRRLYRDPVASSGEWNYVMTPKRGGRQQLTVVPASLLGRYSDTHQIIGVASSAVGESFMEYRRVRYYYKWAFYVGAKEEEEMPDLRFISTL